MMTKPRSYEREARMTDRLRVIRAAQHLVFAILPFREPDSGEHLARFQRTVESASLSPADTDAILLRLLRVLDNHTGGRVPTLVERYASGGEPPLRCLERFSACVVELLRFHGIKDGLVQQALHWIDKHYRDPKLTPGAIAQELGVSLARLDVAFKRTTNSRPRDYIRGKRLDFAALELISTDKTIKQVWADIGYNDHSNFDHDFRRRFGTSPSKYRGRGLRPAAAETYRGSVLASSGESEHDAAATDATSPYARKSVLVVDDDAYMASTVEHVLRAEGALVTTAATGEGGLMAADIVKPEVILLEYRLGSLYHSPCAIDGIEVLRRLRSRVRGAGYNRDSPRVVLWTGDWDIFEHSVEVRALDASIQIKPCDLGSLAAAFVGASDGRCDDPD